MNPTIVKLVTSDQGSPSEKAETEQDRSARHERERIRDNERYEQERKDSHDRAERERLEARRERDEERHPRGDAR